MDNATRSPSGINNAIFSPSEMDNATPSPLGLGNISIYRQYRKTGVCNNGYRRYFHISIISLMQYIAEYRDISQCCTIGLRTQSKDASTILTYFSLITHNTHGDDNKLYLNTLIQY